MTKGQKAETYIPESLADEPIRYSIFGIGVDRKHDAKCLFPQEKGTLHAA
jgi:hypothetical protein